MHCVADFCVIPMGTSTPSVSTHIATAQRVLERSGLTYKMHGYGTGVEGEWADVMRVIGEVHEALHREGVGRVATDVRVGTRVDKDGSLQGKIDSVNQILNGTQQRQQQQDEVRQGGEVKSEEGIKEEQVAVDEAQLLAQAQ